MYLYIPMCMEQLRKRGQHLKDNGSRGRGLEGRKEGRKKKIVMYLSLQKQNSFKKLQIQYENIKQHIL